VSYRVPQLLEVCEQAARVGGAILLEWANRFTVREKGPADLVTQADVAAQEAIRQIIEARFPTHSFIGEEDQPPLRKETASEFCWFVDPLDGTTNYVHKVPHFCTSVAVAERGTVVAAAVYDPISCECYTASRGGGARLNGQVIRASSTTKLSQSLVAASFSSRVDTMSTEICQFVAALLNCRSVRRTGSAALNLCYVAAGRFDCFWALSTRAWDVAAGTLLVEEAGGIVSHWSGKGFQLDRPSPAAAATPELHREFVAMLANAECG
jgi:myo-inositol-1(or 4)-monophosphatase